jgi:hypothetical protein
VCILGDDRYLKRNTGNLIDASKEVGLEMYVKKTKHMLLSRHHNVDQSRDVKATNTSYESVEQYKHSVTTVTNENLIQE